MPGSPATTASSSMNSRATSDPDIFAAGDCTNHPGVRGRALPAGIGPERHRSGQARRSRACWPAHALSRSAMVLVRPV